MDLFIHHRVEDESETENIESVRQWKYVSENTKSGTYQLGYVPKNAKSGTY